AIRPIRKRNAARSDRNTTRARRAGTPRGRMTVRIEDATVAATTSALRTNTTTCMAVMASQITMLPRARRRTAALSAPTRPIPGALLLDGDADERAVLGLGSVVVLDAPVPEQLLQREPGMRRTLPDPAIRDNLRITGDACVVV